MVGEELRAPQRERTEIALRQGHIARAHTQTDTQTDTHTDRQTRIHMYMQIRKKERARKEKRRGEGREGGRISRREEGETSLAGHANGTIYQIVFFYFTLPFYLRGGDQSCRLREWYNLSDCFFIFYCTLLFEGGRPVLPVTRTVQSIWT